VRGAENGIDRRGTSRLKTKQFEIDREYMSDDNCLVYYSNRYTSNSRDKRADGRRTDYKVWGVAFTPSLAPGRRLQGYYGRKIMIDSAIIQSSRGETWLHIQPLLGRSAIAFFTLGWRLWPLGSCSLDSRALII
jgi:hypothetical protein